jgi:hypothetical protein
VAISAVRGDACDGVADEAGGADAAQPVRVADCRVGELEGARDVRESLSVAAPRGTACLVLVLVVVELPEPVEGAPPRRPRRLGDVLLRHDFLRQRVLPRPVLLDVLEPIAHAAAILLAIACEEHLVEVEIGRWADGELETVPADVLWAQPERRHTPGGHRSIPAPEDEVALVPKPTLDVHRHRRGAAVEIRDSLSGVSEEAAVLERADIRHLRSLLAKGRAIQCPEARAHYRLSVLLLTNCGQHVLYVVLVHWVLSAGLHALGVGSAQGVVKHQSAV